MEKGQISWFNPRKAVRVYRGNLPHWRQDDCLYFITFRLADSIPRGIVAQWQSERRAWLEAHGIVGYPESADWRHLFDKLSERDRRMFERMNSRRLFSELDRCHGECLLGRPEMMDTVANAMRYFDEERWRLGDFIIMPNHIHALVQPLHPWNLEDILSSVKRYSAREINRKLNRSGVVWQKEYYDHIVRDRAELSRIRSYIEENPAKAGLAESTATHYRAGWIDSAVS